MYLTRCSRITAAAASLTLLSLVALTAGCTPSEGNRVVGTAPTDITRQRQAEEERIKNDSQMPPAAKAAALALLKNNQANAKGPAPAAANR